MSWQRVWIDTRNGKRGTSYRLRWYDVEGRQRSESVGSDAAQAETERRRKEAEINAGDYRDVQPASLGGYTEEHLELLDGQVQPATVKEHREALNRLVAFFGERRELGSISAIDAKRYFRERRQAVRPCDIGKEEEEQRRIRPATVNKELRTVRAIFNAAVSDGYLRANPFDGIKRLREADRDVRVLEAGEVEALVSACPDDRWRAFLLLAVTTGMRLGELCHLQWRDVDFERGLVAVRNSTAHRTKTGRQRVVGLVSRAAIVLRRLERKSEYVFHVNGHPWRNNLRRTLLAIVEKAGIEACTFHDFRRTFTTAMRRLGASSSVTRAATGHASVEVMERYYTHIGGEDIRQAAERLPWAAQGSITPISPQAQEAAG